MPDQNLRALLDPIVKLSPSERNQLADVQDDPDLMSNDQLLEFRPDRTPTWWPHRRTQNGGDRGPHERQRGLFNRVQGLLPAGFPAAPPQLSEKQNVVNILRPIAYGLTSEESGILSSP